MNITINIAQLIFGAAAVGLSIAGVLQYILKKFIDTLTTSKLQKQQNELTEKLHEQQKQHEIEINDRINENDKEITRLQQKLNVYESNSKILSQDQKAVLSIMLKYQTAYYSNDFIQTRPKNMAKTYEERFKSFVEMSVSNNELTKESILSLRLIHAAYEESEILGKKFLNASNPVIALNVLMMETAGSEQTAKLVSIYMQEVYKKKLEKSGTKNTILCLFC